MWFSGFGGFFGFFLVVGFFWFSGVGGFFCVFGIIGIIDIFGFCELVAFLIGGFGLQERTPANIERSGVSCHCRGGAIIERTGEMDKRRKASLRRWVQCRRDATVGEMQWWGECGGGNSRGSSLPRLVECAWGAIACEMPL